MSNRKSGIRIKRRREAKRLLRDRKIYRLIRVLKLSSETRHRVYRQAIEELSVYFGIPRLPYGTRLTAFPVKDQANGRPMPAWSDLSEWFRVQLAVMAFDNWQFLTFNIHLHPDLETQWIAQERDMRKELRDRIRKELAAAGMGKREFFFVIEGWSKRTKTQTVVHMHGAVAMHDPAEEDVLEHAMARAAGHRIKKRIEPPRSVHSRLFHRAGPAYVNYLFKSVRRKDDRLPDRRLTMSRSATQATREFWEGITDQ